jgi:hypothetical protein
MLDPSSLKERTLPSIAIRRFTAACMKATDPLKVVHQLSCKQK